MIGKDKRFKSTIMCRGTGEFKYIKIIDKKYPDNHITYEVSNDNQLDYLLNSLDEDIINLRNMRKPLWVKIKEKICKLGS